MKTKLVYAALGITAAISLSILRSTVGMAGTKALVQDISFASKATKASFNLGEPVQLEFVVTNKGSNPVKVPLEGVESGSLTIHIANEGGEYKRYFGSGWGREKGIAVTLEPGKSHSYHATILWNGKPRVSHLNDETASRVLSGRIATEYAFPGAGTYLIKGVSSISGKENKLGFKPLKIVVSDPVGVDLEVWNRIKGNRDNRPSDAKRRV